MAQLVSGSNVFCAWLALSGTLLAGNSDNLFVPTTGTSEHSCKLSLRALGNHSREAARPTWC